MTCIWLVHNQAAEVYLCYHDEPRNFIFVAVVNSDVALKYFKYDGIF